jgi:hypothetical protein
VTAQDAATRGELMVSGDAVNVAARLQQHAAVGQIVVGARTHASTQRTLAYDALAPVAAKGKTEPVEAWALLHATAEPATRHTGFDAPLVGRDTELAILRALATRVERDAAPQLVTLYGDAGVGKSRLLAEIGASLPGARVLRGRCLPYEGVTYAPLAEVLKAEAGILDSDATPVAAERLRAMVGALVGDGAAEQRVAEAMAWLLGVSSATGMEPGHVRERLDEAWAAYLGALGREQFTVLAIEDVHWAAAAVLDLVDSLADSLAGTRVLLVCTARPQLLDARPSWGAGKQNATTLTLGALPLDESEQLLSSLLGGSPVPEPVRERVLAGTAGNPFFVEEMLRMLIDERALEQRGDGWVATERLGSVETPDSIHSVLAARLDLLEPEGRDALRRCSVVGQTFWPQAVGVEEEQIASLARSGLVREGRRSAVAGLRQFEFNHVVTRDVAYGTLPRDERRVLHRRVAEWIEASGSDRDLEAAELGAYHFAEALAYGDDDPLVRERAAALALTAGRAAFERAAFEAAEASLGRAAALASRFEDRLEAEILLVQSESIDGRVDRALQRLEGLQAPAGDLDSRAEILSWCSRLYWLTGRWEASMQAADDAVALFSGREDSVPLARALARRSQLAMLKNLPEAVSYAEEAVEMARRTGDLLAEVNARINLFTAAAARGQAPDREEVLHIVEVAVSIADYEDAYRALINLVWCAPGYLTHDSVNSVLAEAHARFPELVRPRALGGYLDASLVDLLISAGRFGEARAALEAIERNRLYEPAEIVWLHVSAALALRCEGPAAASPFLEELRPRALATEEAQRILPMVAVAVPTYALQGMNEEARAVAVEALHVLGPRAAAAFSAVPIVRGLAAIGAHDVLRDYLAVQQSRAGGPIDGRLASSIAAGQALIALAEGRAEDAVAAVRPRAERERADGWLYDATALDLILADALAVAGRVEEAAVVRARIDAFCAANGCRYLV